MYFFHFGMHLLNVGIQRGEVFCDGVAHATSEPFPVVGRGKHKTAEDFLKALASQPAASFHEEWVSACIQEMLRQIGVPFRLDSFGNIIAHYRKGTPARSIALVAHMDHPAFEITAKRGKSYQARVLGGYLLPYFSPGTPLRLFTTEGEVTATVVRARVVPGYDRPVLTVSADGPAKAGDWGVLDLPDHYVEGDYIHMRAVDDLGGCSLALATLQELQERQQSGDVYALFTRAEEVGLVGATLLARSRAIPKSTTIISLEASRSRPIAEAGNGPVIRVGDLRSTFSWDAELLLHAGLARVQVDNPKFKVQRQLMEGGTCEATAFGAFGYACTGIALPLGNYHNMSAAGTFAPEFIHRGDLAGAAELLIATVEASQDEVPNFLRQRYGEVSPEYRRRLQRTAAKMSVNRGESDA